MRNYIWLIEDRQPTRDNHNIWIPTGDRNGEYRIYLTRESAKNMMKTRYYGHPKDLRARKYVREEK